MLEGKRCLVTGSSGFIGSRLVKALEKVGAVVVGLDKATGFDISDREALKSIMRGTDYVFHMAVLPFNPCTQNPRECIEVNAIGTLNVVETSEVVGVKKIVYSSASAVYGNIDTVTAVNEDHPCNPDSLYGVSKLMGELIVKNSKVPYIILRYMNVYGPGQKNGLIPAVLNCVVSNIPPTINGDGQQAFDFVHVDDVVYANLLATNSGATNEIFNIGGENEITVREVVDAVLRHSGSQLTPVFKEGGPARRVGSSAKAKLLGYAPLISFNEGIKELACEHTNHQTVSG